MSDFNRYTFRGKRIDNGEWVFGYFFHDLFNAYDEPKDDSESYHIISFSDCSGFELNIHSKASLFDIDKETIGQCTGLKDKNGVMIFEGDVIKQDNFQKFVSKIVWDNKLARFMNDAISGGAILNTCDPKYCEIIGNIHDNPELL